jgi:hypothetical protein
MNTISSILTIGACVLLATAAYADDAAPTYQNQKWAPWIDAEADPGAHRSLGQFDLFAPIVQDDTSLIFVNPRMRFDDQGSREYNWGAGYRTLWDKEWVLGGYVYADRTRSSLNNYFSQVTAGLEAMSENWKYRVNDYQPFGTREYSGQNPAVIAANGTLEISSDTERSLPGDDVEVGYRVPLYDASSLKQLWVYAGGYRFDAPDVRTIEGPRLRFEYEVGDVTVADRNLRLRLSGEVEHDAVRNTQYFAGIRIGIPLEDSGSSENTSKLTPLERHMVDPVQRDVDIVTGSKATNEAAINTYNNETVSGVSTINANTSNIASAVTAAGVNSVVVVDGSNGTIIIPTSTNITMNNGQTLLGGGSSLLLRGANSGLQLTYTAPGTMPTVTGNYLHYGSDALFNLATNGNVITGMEVSNTGCCTGGGYVFLGRYISHLTIINNILSTTGTGNTDIRILYGNGAIISNNIIISSGFGSSGIGNYATSVSITNNTFSIFGNYVAGIGDNNAGVNGSGSIISNNTFNASGTNAVGIGEEANYSVITNNKFNLSGGTSSTAMQFWGGGVGTIVNGNNIVASNGTYGISLNTTTGISGNNNTFTGTNLCSDGGGNTGSIGFVGGGHCP